MAKTKKKRRRKHKGTQGGRVDTRPSRSRPRSRAEARAQAAQRRSSAKKGSGRGKSGAAARQDRLLTPPTWKSAFSKGGLAAVLFFVLFALVFKRPVGAAALISLFMLGFYVPMSFYVDSFMYKRRLKAAASSASRPGASGKGSGGVDQKGTDE